MMRRVLLALTVGLVGVPQAFAIDPRADKPYDFQVILRIAPHRLLTPTFRRQLQADLQDSLQAALGTLAHVQILDAATLPPAAWLDPTALPTHSPLHPAKRHFVEVSYTNGQYIIRACQLDGSTGLASPVPRQDRTADRAFVTRLVTRLIDQDFGAVGIVVGKDGDRVRLRLRGGAVSGAEVGRWVPVGSVFALARIEGEPPRGQPVEGALLQTVGEPKGGEVECRFFYRYRDSRGRDPLADWQTVGFRALRLGTTAATVRLRIVDPDGIPVNAQVRVSPTSFQPGEVREHGVARDGLYETIAPYEHVAFVRIESSMPAQIPVAVLDDRTIVCQVSTKPNDEARMMIGVEVRNVRAMLFDALNRLREQNRKLVELIQSTQNKEALAKVQASLERLDTELGHLTEEVYRLRKEAQRVGAEVGSALDECEVCLKEIRKRRESLVRTQDELEKVVQTEDGPEARRQQDSYVGLLQRAANLYDDAEFEQAIETYKELLQRFGERAEVRARLTELEKGWEIKSEEQRRARAFAYGDWAALATVDDLRTHLPQAREALAACRAVGDRLTARKLFLVATTKATDIVVRRSEELMSGLTDDERILLKPLEELSKDLREFIKEMSAFLQEGGG